ncbi:biosynthesis protein PigD [Zooshikella marina]|uniref:biosynthesis protein PigD n=1 Tax=Zooshikella ganghwensis TaxID=202772 RepID=UPI001BB0C03C|nr:biosynthesis protein PigD [Zooshikella ganghwensis]MBU2704940.1 biosynthesis protein PigD [Zooshikella ganghwensis]
MDITIGVVVVTESRYFFETGLSVLSDIRGELFQRVTIDSDIKAEQFTPSYHPVYDEAREKAIRFMAKRKERVSMRVVQASNLNEATSKIINIANNLNENELFQVGMIYLDYANPKYEMLTIKDIDKKISGFYSTLCENNVPAFYSSFSVAAFTLPHKRKIRYQPMEFIECSLPHNRAILQAELLCLWMDFIEMALVNRRVKPEIKGFANNTLGQLLCNFLTTTSTKNWNGYYFTGSLVSNLINYLEMEAKKTGIKLLRGPSEHSLACGAMANWQLYKKSFLIVVTSGMIDEFKGTLANLREARAKGFIVCAENRPNQWFAFQGTISKDEDTRDVLTAKRIPHVFMDDPDTIEDDFKKAVRLYSLNQGPVVIMATQAVLDACSTIDLELPMTNTVEDDLPLPQDLVKQLDQVMEIINNGPEKIVWQCGPLSEEELELVLSIAERAGIALVDSLNYPGSVTKYHKGVCNKNYLGTLAVYGYSPRVYNFLHTNNKLNSSSEQYLFFLKSKLHQAATPFSEGRLQRRLSIVQLTNNMDHISPYADHPLVMNLYTFLRYVDVHLDVSTELRNKRMAAIQCVDETPSDVVSKLPKVPMTPNYFFSRLNSLIEKMIVEDSYDYTGLYDVGRCGISAVRNVVRTRRGFSGWYGRGLMGDALQSVISIAATCPTHIIGFIGDGAKGLVPDVLPSLVENALTYPDSIDKNITLFYFMNGGHSVINTYQERILFNRTSRQMRLMNIYSPDWEEQIHGFKIKSKTIDIFDYEMFRMSLQEKNCINLFSIIVSHNNEGDGISLATATGWQRDDVENKVKSIKHENLEKQLEPV